MCECDEDLRGLEDLRERDFRVGEREVLREDLRGLEDLRLGYCEDLREREDFCLGDREYFLWRSGRFT